MNPEQYKQTFALSTWMFNQVPKHKQKGRLTELQRKIMGFKSTPADRKAKKSQRQNKRIGRLHNGGN